ncbi:MAG: beta-lactamase family protein [Clostridia bacterium]|nr:beta-lactamase family protein [Clostridia bacterium]
MAFHNGTRLASKISGWDEDIVCRSVNENTAFPIGSLSEIVIGAVLIRLAMRGKLSLGDCMREFFRSYPNEKDTVMDVLCYRSCYVPLSNIENWPSEHSLAAMHIMQQMRDSEPQHKRIGCVPLGYALIVALIEKITNESIQSYASKEIFSVLGMKNTYFGGGVGYGEDVLPVYDPNTDTYDFNHSLCHFGYPQVFSTADDLVLLIEAIREANRKTCKGLFVPAAAKLFLGGTEERRALLFHRDCEKGIADAQKSNYFPDFCSRNTYGRMSENGCTFLLDPEEDLSAVILTNGVDMRKWERACRYLYQRLYALTYGNVLRM